MAWFFGVLYRAKMREKNDEKRSRLTRSFFFLFAGAIVAWNSSSSVSFWALLRFVESFIDEAVSDSHLFSKHAASNILPRCPLGASQVDSGVERCSFHDIVIQARPGAVVALANALVEIGRFEFPRSEPGSAHLFWLSRSAAGDLLASLAGVVVSVSVVVHVFVVAPHEVLSAFPHVKDVVVLAAFWTAWHGRNGAIFLLDPVALETARIARADRERA